MFIVQCNAMQCNAMQIIMMRFRRKDHTWWSVSPILDVFRLQQIASADEKGKALGRGDFSNQNLIQITPSVATHPSS